MRNRRAIELLASLALVLIGAHVQAAQQSCLYWQNIPQPPGTDPILTMVSFDAGSGPMMYVGSYCVDAGYPTCGHIARWDGTSWTIPPGGGLASDINESVKALADYHDPVAGHSLVAGGNFSFTTTSGATSYSLARWVGGTWSPFGLPSASGVYGEVFSLAVDGSTLYVGGSFSSVNGTGAANIASWNGTNWSAVGGGLGNGGLDTVEAMVMYDDGYGQALYAAGLFASAGGVAVNHIAKWDGTSWTPVGTLPNDGTDGPIFALTAFDDGHGSALYVAGAFMHAGAGPALHIAKWDGVNWSPLGPGIGGNVFALTGFDDGNGPALYAGGGFLQIGGVPIFDVAKWNGSAWEALGAGIGGGTGGYVHALCPYDSTPRSHQLCAGGDFIVAGALPARNFAAWSACSTPVSSFCFGDGTVAPCPCANLGAAGHGCENSQATGGARLAFSGMPNPDSIVLHSSGELASALSLVLQGDEVISASQSFGDGLLCAGGNHRRLYVKSAVNGQVDAPSGADPSITARSGALGDPLGPGSIRYYQIYYRDPSPSFCAAPAGGTFNATNGFRIVW